MAMTMHDRVNKLLNKYGHDQDSVNGMMQHVDQARRMYPNAKAAYLCYVVSYLWRNRDR
jgi:hypothetical protein